MALKVGLSRGLGCLFTWGIREENNKHTTVQSSQCRVHSVHSATVTQSDTEENIIASDTVGQQL